MVVNIWLLSTSEDKTPLFDFGKRPLGPGTAPSRQWLGAGDFQEG